MKREWIEEALIGTGWTFEDVEAGIKRGDFHLFENESGCLIGEFVVSPRSTAFHVWVAGGDKNDGGLAAIQALVPVAEDFARQHKCQIAGATGRQGWVRFLGKFGYKASTPAVEKEL